jgi:hypothetical protein
MAGESWRLAPEVVAEAAQDRARERRRAALLFGICVALLAPLFLVAVLALYEDRALHGDVGTALGVLGGFMMVAISLALRAARERRRLMQVIAETGDPSIEWVLSGEQIVASARPELAFDIPARTQAALTEVPRATALRP